MGTRIACVQFMPPRIINKHAFIHLGIQTLVMFALGATGCQCQELSWITLTEDKTGFCFAESSQKFVPFGFNYDHDRDGNLLEDYWDDDWDDVESDFREMKALGANVVRIHLQFGKFMESTTKPRKKALGKLAELLKLAERTELYLDITGLGCYHKEDVPNWYNELTEKQRWDAQANFWRAVAKACCESPAVFCYDLMNEPVVPGGDKKRDDWLGPPFGNKHFVQFIALDRAGRERSTIAKNWIKSLVSAIRQHDKRHLITVGLVPWSLDRPGLTSGFVPEKIADELDFIAVHIYPEQGKIDEAIETLNGFVAAGKPVVIEETFTLKCGKEEFKAFFEKSEDLAAGWIGFYWGATPAELRKEKTIGAAITLQWLEMFKQLKNQLDLKNQIN